MFSFRVRVICTALPSSNRNVCVRCGLCALGGRHRGNGVGWVPFAPVDYRSIALRQNDEKIVCNPSTIAVNATIEPMVNVTELKPDAIHW